MTTRLTVAAWAALAIAITALATGNRWAFLTALTTSAALWIWRGAIDWCDRPKPPEGVRIIHPDGTEAPCAMTYNDIDEDGCHEWLITTRLHVGDRVYCAKLPGRTSLVFFTDDDVTGVRGDGRLDYRMEG